MEKKELKKRVTELKKEKQSLTEQLAEAFSAGKSTEAIVAKLSNVQLELTPLERELGMLEESENWSARWQEPANLEMWSEIERRFSAFNGKNVSCKVEKTFSKGAKCTLVYTIETEECVQAVFKQSFLPQITKVDGNGVQVIVSDARAL